jgi:hypothetical protein
MTDFEASLWSTIDHACLIQERINRLLSKQADAVAAAAAQAERVPRHVAMMAWQSLADAAVRGRGAVHAVARRPPRLGPGEQLRILRGEPKPVVAHPGVVLVYVLFGSDGQVLYVGVTKDPLTRFDAHRSKAWTDAEFYGCTDRAAALRLEGDLIFQHKPPENLEGKRKRRFVA